MNIGESQITKEQMPSYVSPAMQPQHNYQSIQDIFAAKLYLQQPQMPNQVYPTVSKEVSQDNWR